MLSGSFNLTHFFQRHASSLRQGSVLLCAVFLLSFFTVEKAGAQTCVYDTKILASNNPFSACPIGVDTIIIKDTLVLDVNFEPIFGGVPFNGIFLVDGGVLWWS
jgi:hypothetical protein